LTIAAKRRLGPALSKTSSRLIAPKAFGVAEVESRSPVERAAATLLIRGDCVKRLGYHKRRYND
jgi:hypothetical protein